MPGVSTVEGETFVPVVVIPDEVRGRQNGDGNINQIAMKQPTLSNEIPKIDGSRMTAGGEGGFSPVGFFLKLISATGSAGAVVLGAAVYMADREGAKMLQEVVDVWREG